MKFESDKESFVSELIRIVRRDDVSDEREKHMLYTAARLLDINEFRLEELKNNPLPYSPPKKEVDRIVQFYQMSLIAYSDNKLVNREKDYLVWLGLKMGFREKAVEAVLELIKNNSGSSLKPEELIKIFQTYHN